MGNKASQYAGVVLVGGLAIGAFYLWRSGKLDSFFSDSPVLDGSIGGGSSEETANPDYGILYQKPITTQESTYQEVSSAIANPVYKSVSSGNIVDIFAKSSIADPDRFAINPNGGYLDRFEQQSIDTNTLNNRYPEFVRAAQNVVSANISTATTTKKTTAKDVIAAIESPAKKSSSSSSRSSSNSIVNAAAAKVQSYKTYGGNSSERTARAAAVEKLLKINQERAKETK